MARKANSPGALRSRITIQTPTDTSDSRGGVTKSWGTHVTAWAAVTPVSSREYLLHGQVQGAISHRVSMRYQASITPKMRVSWGSRIFQITGVRNMGEESRWLELDCTEELL